MQNKYWYAIYTRSRFEKKVKAELDLKKIETFLPLWKEVSQWSDRKKIVEVPVFKGYLFVHIDLIKEQTKIYGTKGIVKFVSFNGKIAKVNEKELNWVRLILSETVRPITDVKKFVAGDKVRINSGPLRDVEGIVSKTSKKLVQIYLESIKQAIYIQVNPEILIKC